MDRFLGMEVVVAVVDEGSFVKAARRLNMSPPTVTRVVSELEDHLGVKLLTRTTRWVRPTDAGARYVEEARHILDLVEAADATLLEAYHEPKGHLTITAPVLFGRMCVMPWVVAFLKAYPKITVTTLFLDRIVHLMEEGIDVAIRIGHLSDSSLRAIRLGFIRRVVCASPSYLAQAGTPAHPEELADHSIVAAQSVNSASEWRFNGPQGLVSVRLAPRLITTSNDSAIEAVLQGFGITRLLSYQIAPHVQAGTLVTVLDAFDSDRLPVHLVHHEGQRISAKTKAFLNFMVDALKNEPVLGSDKKA